jgi:hypothetical protein
MLPQNVRAARALHSQLDASISPENLTEPIIVLKGTSTSVLILVGKKP